MPPYKVDQKEREGPADGAELWEYDRSLDHLPDKEKLFIFKYLNCFNVTEAARTAKYKNPKVSGWQLYHKKRIKKQIDFRIEEQLSTLKIDAQWLLRRLVEEVSADLGDLYDDNNCLRPIKNWPEVWRRGMITGVTHDKIINNKLTRIRLESRTKLFELIGKHIDVQAFSENTNVIVPGLAEVLEQLSGRSRGLPPAAQAALPASEPRNILRKHDPEVAIPELETAAPKLAMWTPDQQQKSESIHNDHK